MTAPLINIMIHPSRFCDALRDLANMKTFLLSVAFASVAMFSGLALATQPGNNGGGNGGCGVGQQTNGCGGQGGAGGSGGDAAGTGVGIGVGLGGSSTAGAAAGAISGSLSGANASTGPITNTNNATGGAGGRSDASASSNGTNVGINGIDRSGNSTNTLGQNTDVRNNNLNSQGQGQSSRNSQDASTRSGVQSSGNSTTNVDASDRSSSSYKAVAHAPIIHGAAAPALATANMIVTPGVCGPRHFIEKADFTGRHHGIMWDNTFKQGDDYTAVPAASPFLSKDGYLIGHMLNEYVAVVGTSSGKSLSIQGFGKEQNGGGAGGAASGSHQQIVVRVTIKDCVMQTAAVAASVAAAPTLPVVSKVGE